MSGSGEVAGSNGSTKTAILVAIGVVAVIGVFGVIRVPDKSTEIMGFCTLIEVTLLGAFQQAKAAAKVEEVAKVAQTAAVKVEQVAVAAEKAAVDVREVKKTLVETTSENAKKMDVTISTLNVIHKLVNNDMHIALVTIRDKCQQEAKRTGDPADIEDARLAQQNLERHDEKQRAADKVIATQDAKDAH